MSLENKIKPSAMLCSLYSLRPSKPMLNAINNDEIRKHKNVKYHIKRKQEVYGEG
jgi:hypothetical protein